MEALGLIETLGFVAAVEATDVALKSANVTFLGKQKVKAGIITIMIQGDVGAVKASVDAATNAAAKVGTVLSSHVIPRIDKNAKDVLFNDVNKPVIVPTPKKTEVKNTVIEPKKDDKPEPTKTLDVKPSNTPNKK